MKIQNELKTIREKALENFDELYDTVINNGEKRLIKLKSQVVNQEELNEDIGDKIRNFIFGIDRSGWVTYYYTLEHNNMDNLNNCLNITDSYEIRLQDKEVENYLNSPAIQYQDIKCILNKFDQIINMK